MLHYALSIQFIVFYNFLMVSESRNLHRTYIQVQPDPNLPGMVDLGAGSPD